jgi:hypothetical protein
VVDVNAPSSVQDVTMSSHLAINMATGLLLLSATSIEHHFSVKSVYSKIE